MGLWITIGALAAIVTAIGTAMGIRQRRAGDYQERLDARDQPNRLHEEGQKMAAVGLAHRSGSGRFGSF
ncbi:hypothetical protein ACEXQE_01670 [Herbiconiux sp. P17]|uniref:hypothetical protein n=1 Tax=Herbiconiux wuyangfengii TaxID=3342794 RepID=UPI0035B84BF7